MKTIINNLKKYMLVSSVLISAVTMADSNVISPVSPELNNKDIMSFYVEVLSGNINEKALEMEKWMYDISYWSYSWIAEVSESDLVIENWMTDASYWNYSWITEVNEPEVLIEDWMLDPEHWRFSRRHVCARLNEAAVPEKSMRINDWMKDPERCTTGS